MTTARAVAEVRDPGSLPIWRHPEWRERFPWLEQGMTGKGAGPDPFDLGLFGQTPAGVLIERWRSIREATGMTTVLHARQVHGTAIGHWDSPPPAGLCFVEDLDAHTTALPGLLLAVSTADCVPIFLVAERRRTVALVHAGWRGVAGGALEAMVDRLAADGVPARDLWLHCGPSICGACYEVGPEVHRAVRPDRPTPASPTPIDLHAALVARATTLGLQEDRLTTSSRCTLCGPDDFFSHRGGDRGRQMGILGLRR